MITEKQNREHNRYRDIGSGIAWKLLPTKILSVLFNPYIQIRILNIWAKSDLLDKANWNTQYGVGYINDSEQLRVLVATRSEIEQITGVLKDISHETVTDTEDPNIDDVVTSLTTTSTEKSKAMLNLILDSLSKVTIAKVYDYSVTGKFGIRGSIHRFIKDHVDDPSKGYVRRFVLHSDNTNQTGHSNITVRSIPLSINKTDMLPSSPIMINRQQAINAEKAANTPSIFRQAAIQLSSILGD